MGPIGGGARGGSRVAAWRSRPRGPGKRPPDQRGRWVDETTARHDGAPRVKRATPEERAADLEASAAAAEKAASTAAAAAAAALALAAPQAATASFASRLSRVRSSIGARGADA